MFGLFRVCIVIVVLVNFLSVVGVFLGLSFVLVNSFLF